MATSPLPFFPTTTAAYALASVYPAPPIRAGAPSTATAYHHSFPSQIHTQKCPNWPPTAPTPIHGDLHHHHFPPTHDHLTVQATPQPSAAPTAPNRAHPQPQSSHAPLLQLLDREVNSIQRHTFDASSPPKEVGKYTAGAFRPHAAAQPHRRLRSRPHAEEARPHPDGLAPARADALLLVHQDGHGPLQAGQDRHHEAVPQDGDQAPATFEKHATASTSGPRLPPHHGLLDDVFDRIPEVTSPPPSRFSNMGVEASSSETSLSSHFGEFLAATTPTCASVSATSASTMPSATAYTALQVFGEMPTPRSGYENYCSGHLNHIQSSRVSNLREPNLAEHLNHIQSSHGSEHSYYMLPEDSPVEQAAQPMSPSAVEHVGVTTPLSLACLGPGVCSKANQRAGYESLLVHDHVQPPTAAQDDHSGFKEMPVYDVYEEDEEDNSYSIGSCNLLDTNLAIQRDGEGKPETEHTPRYFSNPSENEIPSQPQMSATSTDQMQFAIFESMPKYDVYEEEDSACLTTTSNLQDFNLELQQQDGERACKCPFPKASDSLVTRSSQLSVDHSMSRLRMLWDPGASASLHSNKSKPPEEFSYVAMFVPEVLNLCIQAGSYVQQLRDSRWSVLVTHERRKEWDPGDTNLHFLFTTSAGATKLECTDVYKSAMARSLCATTAMQVTDCMQNIASNGINHVLNTTALIMQSAAHLPQDNYLCFLYYNSVLKTEYQGMRYVWAFSLEKERQVQWDPGIESHLFSYKGLYVHMIQLLNCSPIDALSRLQCPALADLQYNSTDICTRNTGIARYHRLQSWTATTEIHLSSLQTPEQATWQSRVTNASYVWDSGNILSQYKTILLLLFTEEMEMVTLILDQWEFLNQRSVQENHNAKQLLVSSKNCLHIWEIDILFITFLPP